MTETLLVEFTTDDASDASPSWTDVTSYVRGFSSSRGRDNVRSRVEAGTATVLVDNRTRLFDPTYNILIRPNNRWRISETGSGEEVFLGYATAYKMGWPSVSGVDSVTEVELVDEFRMLAMDRLPAMDPPLETYQDVVLFDGATGYWPMVSVLYTGVTQPAVVGDALEAPNGAASQTGLGAIVGQADPGYLINFGTFYWRSPELVYAHPGDAGGLDEFTIEGWFGLNATPGGTYLLFSGPNGIPSATYTWKMSVNTSRQIVLQAKNSGGTVHTCTSTTALTLSTVDPIFYHLAGTITDGSLRLYVNGVQEASTAWTGVFEFLDNANYFIVGNGGTTIGGDFHYFDEVAWYRVGLPADRVLAHYTAGTARGFEIGQLPGDRFDSVLSTAGTVAASDTRTGTREMTGAMMVGQSPLDELRACEDADNVDAFMFVAKDGTITFLDDGHRSSSPWNTVQAVFTDDGTGHEYTDIQVEFDDTFLANDIRVTREGGTTVTETDAASISANGPRPLPLSSLPIRDDADVATIASALLEKYTAGFFRVSGLSVRTHVDATRDAVLGLELGDRIQVIRSTIPTDDYLYPSTTLYPGTSEYPGAGPIDQILFVQKIDVSGAPGVPWLVRLGVSPL